MEYNPYIGWESVFIKTHKLATEQDFKCRSQISIDNAFISAHTQHRIIEFALGWYYLDPKNETLNIIYANGDTHVVNTSGMATRKDIINVIGDKIHVSRDITIPDRYYDIYTLEEVYLTYPDIYGSETEFIGEAKNGLIFGNTEYIGPNYVFLMISSDRGLYFKIYNRHTGKFIIQIYSHYIIDNTEKYLLIAENSHFVVYEMPEFNKLYSVDTRLISEEFDGTVLTPDGQILLYKTYDIGTNIKLYVPYINEWRDLNITIKIVSYNSFNGYFLFEDGRICQFIK